MRAAGYAAGLALAGVAVLGWRVPPGGTPLGLDLRVAMNSTGQLGVTTPAVLSADHLEPGEPAVRGSAEVVNQTSGALPVRVRAVPGDGAVDAALAVEVTADRRPVFRGSLGELRAWSPRAFRVAPGGRATVAVTAWLPPDTGPGWAGRLEHVALELSVGN